MWRTLFRRSTTRYATIDIHNFNSCDTGKTVPLESHSDEDLDIETLKNDLIDLLMTLFPDPQKASTFLVGIQATCSVQSLSAYLAYWA